MNIQIYGAGIAGTYLFHLLSENGYKVSIWDKRKEPDCRCAWGIVYKEAKRFYSEIGLNFDDYVLLKPRYVVANGLWLKNRDIVIFDKKRLLSDLWVDLSVSDNPELIIDATGVSRAFLPPIHEDRVLPTSQCIEKHDVEENIYIQMEKTGYAWAFPLGERKWHVGAGNVEREKIPVFINKLREKYGFEESERACQCSAKVRLLQPSKCLPFVSGNIVGVGEAIGCVSGAGEGNAPSLASAMILFDCINRGNLSEYEGRILKELEWVEVEQRFVDAMLNNKYLSAIRLLPKIIAIENGRTVQHSVKDIRKLINI
ncbi:MULTISPECIES: NAD(P)/FAD-dependent oxidoreductase [unclassified Archaeoglobus]|jgi:flavin-dependent dehydrogenase|uniref:NAD(P)/FAD-dependent oxidoreductase n=1 Tax=unclassified Archaeoglobus TaxID=2643606 RepID=UPI0025B8676C|nr:MULTISPECIES: NAD(P)/FAD-dependent oxidoreductase [unclassified Archaeoglobus]